MRAKSLEGGRGPRADAVSGAAAARLRNVSKAFSGVKALRNVSLEIARGEVHALVGGNGSGKSTLVKVMAGLQEGDSGELEVGGRRYELDSFSADLARAAGLHFVHQERTVFPELTIAENLSIGRGFETRTLGFLDSAAISRRCGDVLRRFGVAASPEARLNTLGPAQQTMVAIARALQDQEEENSGLLVLDEPTASLPPTESALLLAALRNYAAAGQAILFISHRLDEILAVAERVSVLRDGAHVATVDAASLDEDGLVELIVGRPVDSYFPDKRAAESRSVALDVRDLSGGPVKGISLKLYEREVLGLAGLVGSGSSELLRMIFGADHSAGEVRVGGVAIPLNDPRDAIASGVGYIPPDRASHALFPERSVVENMTLSCMPDYFRRGRLRVKAARQDARVLSERFGIRTSSLTGPISELSGGNQQKVVLARWMRRNPRLLLLDEPTQGVDVGARAEIWSSLLDAIRDGAAALVISSDFEELAHNCDRVLIIAHGRVTGELNEPLTAHRITEMVHASEVAA